MVELKVFPYKKQKTIMSVGQLWRGGILKRQIAHLGGEEYGRVNRRAEATGLVNELAGPFDESLEL